MRYSVVGLFLALVWMVCSSFSPGNQAYTKRDNTVLRDSPSLGGGTVGKLPWGAAVKITKVEGRWVKVSGSGKSGWVFSGNLAKKKPPSENKNDFLPTAASDTSASMAARPLSETAKKYGKRRNLGSALSDLHWLESTTNTISNQTVDAYMKEKGLGEYQK